MVSPLLASLFDDPPMVHPTSPTGVWRTDNSCYSLMEQQVSRGSTTLEMGLGLSTALFCLLECEHTTIFFDSEEEQLFRKWAQRRELSVDNIQFIVGKSEEILPNLQLPALDAVFIDGGHGFPGPIIDWFYGARHLREGGLLVLDDIQFFAPAQLDGVLQLDSRWTPLQRTPKWSAYRRDWSGPLAEHEWQQPFVHPAEPRPGYDW